MTPNDTFRRLKRRPFNEVWSNIIFDNYPSKSAPPDADDARKYLRDAGWTLKELQIEGRRVEAEERARYLEFINLLMKGNNNDTK